MHALSVVHFFSALFDMPKKGQKPEDARSWILNHKNVFYWFADLVIDWRADTIVLADHQIDAGAHGHASFQAGR